MLDVGIGVCKWCGYMLKYDHHCYECGRLFFTNEVDRPEVTDLCPTHIVLGFQEPPSIVDIVYIPE